MSFTVQHKRSSTADKRPAPGDLVDGQLAVNLESSAPGIFFKASDGTLVKAGPVFVSNSAPTPTNYTTLSIGETWLDNSDPSLPTLKVWDGTAWQGVSGAGTIWETEVIGSDTVIRPLNDGRDIVPYTNGGASLGREDRRWRNVYQQDIDLSNEGRGNDVDGTWGSYLIQEGEDDLFLINRRSGKKYRFMLEEVE